jgi:UDP-GlcNAc3NAcA epimerase
VVKEKIKIVTVIGARPQIIKAAAISRAIANIYFNKIEEVIVHTGQHYDENMSDVFFCELGIPKEKYNLHVGSATHAKQTAQIMFKLEEVLKQEKPDALIVYGDTNSTLAATLTAAKLFVPVIHIEAGLRSFNKKMPEEINRICCDHVSTLLFSPTLTGIKNLKKEGFNVNAKAPFTIDNPKVYHCGDVMYDNSIYFEKEASEQSQILENLKLKPNEYVLVTVHRDSNTDIGKNLNSLFSSFDELSKEYQLNFVLPLHPRAKKMSQQLLSSKLYKTITENHFIKIIEPVSFLDMIMLEANCKLILTDSGGVQKESYFFKKPCVILRTETEWIELVKQGTAKICGANKTKIKNAFSFFMDNQNLEFPKNFGDGKAAEFICEQILKCFKS